MPDRTPYQRGIIHRYYENADAIMLERLGIIVSELYLAETERKRESLWKRAGRAMKGLKVPARLLEHILASRDPEVLARNVRDWQKKRIIN